MSSKPSWPGDFIDRIVEGDCRKIMPKHGPYDMILADPPYSDTSLKWDREVEGWVALARESLKPTGSLWLFGSMRFLMMMGQETQDVGLRLAQDIVWEKHNGSGFQNDRFKRVHEHVIQLYRRDAEWRQVFNDVQMTHDSRRRVVRRKQRPPHMGDIGRGYYESEDGGPRIQRSVIFMRSCHGRAIHPTEKPVGLLEILIRTSCPPGGLVGDWFAGSGAVGEACRMSGRRYIGCEKDRCMADLANQRLGGLLYDSPPSASIDPEPTA